MAKKHSWIAWMVGIALALASLAIGSAMAGGALAVPYIGGFLNKAAGWTVITTSLIGIGGALVFGIKRLVR